MRRWARLHVLATAIIGLQLVAWAITGFAFTLFDFRVVRGSDDRAESPAIDFASVRLSPEAAAGVSATSVRLLTVDGRPVYHVVSSSGERLVDAENGRTLSIDEAMAGRLAVSAFRTAVAVRRVERGSDEGRALYIVHLDDPRDTHVHIDATSGEIVSWRNRRWRQFDTLWSIHVLGYVDRKSPANWPLRIVGSLAAVATLSGAVLLLRRLKPRRKSWLVTKLLPSAWG